MNKGEQQFLKNYDTTKFDRPNTTVDVVIYSIIDNKLNVLIVKREEYPYKNQWALVGGFIDIKKDKCLEDCAFRKLYEKTGVKSPYLEQFGTVGNEARDPRGWSISTIYFALLEQGDINFRTDNKNSNKLRWIPVSNGIIETKLSFDHNEIIKECTERLKNKILYSDLPLYFLKGPFTLRSLREVYEILLETKLEPKTFRRRMLNANVLIETGDVIKNESKKPAMLYKAVDLKKPYYFRVLMLST